MASNISNLNDFSVLNRVKFGVFLTLQLPSVACSLYLFSQYATRKPLRHSIHHHVIMVLLCSSLIFVAVPVSASEAFFFTSRVRPTSNVFCAVWTWIHYSINIGNLMLMAFACGERHWLVFCLNPMPTRGYRLLCHYLPIAACMIYPCLFYFILIFLHPCEPVYDFTQLLCLMPCYFLDTLVGSVDTFLNNWTPIFAIPVLSGALLIRFLARKRQVQLQAFQWKRDRKLVVSLLSVTVLYVLMWAPLQAAVLYAYICNGGMTSQFEVDYLYSLPYFVHLLYPFVVFLSNGELRQRRGQVRP